MPTRTIPRRSTAPARGPGRLGRPMPAQRPAARGRRKQQQSSGLFASAMRALPIGVAAKRSKRGGTSKRGPAVGLLMAGAGAFLGRRQMRKRRARDTIEQPTPMV